ncbi:cell wall-binding repeat-containing protein [Clostridium estertheticum]|uniref:Cell wall-binding repeat-containing protein n=1 Tax=Clostridium estertheticum TaxID=238834 RepID=A0A5N7ISP6_9CLOT|nr:cell wall-binding repeat-containing protein [Clostridium estertheticum]MPQ33301.1 cell wall-binding repeat-containing protein [Clostridium estertheticum]MPQ63959.1 cell wall-binding repeat-containing protein [Clostridium estertheticum]
MNKKITSTALAALMIAGSTSFSAFAAMDSGTVVIGTKAFDLAYANDPANATEISAAINAGGTVYVKDFNGNWLDNITGASINASVIPAVTYTNSKGTTQIGAGDASTVAATSEVTTAMAANALKVTFNGTVADTSKVTFDVKAVGGTAITTVVSWNTAKTEATLTKTSSFTAGDYTVAVTNNTVVLPTQTVTMSQQKIAKIQILSTKLGVTTNAKTSLQKGYATYAILDQYGVDITNGALANNVNFQTGVGTADAKKGLITITPASGLNLMTFNSGVTITANDTNTGTSATATLAVTSQLGTLTNITLTGLTNVDNKVLTAGDTTDVFYAAFTATDISGNPTTNYTLMKQGLIFSGVNDDNSLTTSSPNVTAKLVQDPNDSNKGVIEVRTNADPLTVDMPLVITAMTWTGSTSQINTTLHKQAEVYTFTLLAPADSIASGESKEIPFIALDQNGGKLTKFSDFTTDLVTFNGLIASRNNDGTLSLKNIPVLNTNGTASIPEVVSAMTKSGKYSNLTLNIQKPTVADTLSLDTTKLNTTMQAASTTGKSATQFADFGWDNGGLTLKDQYDRAIDINASENASTYKNYKVVAKSSNPTVITAGSAPALSGGKLTDGSATGVAGVGEDEIAIQSLAAGSSTVSFSVYDISQKNSAGALIFNAATKNYSDLTAIDTKTQTFTVLDDKDIKDYKIDAVTTPMYAINTLTNGVADSVIKASKLGGQIDDYKANPKVYGTTTTGSKVVLRGTPITGASSSSSDFTVYAGAAGGGNVAYDGVKIIANKFVDPAKTGSSATISVSLLGADGINHTVTTAVTSLKADPVATSIDANVDTYVPGITRLDDVVTLTPTGTDTYASLLGKTLSKYDALGNKGHVYFAPVDQYGETAFPLSQFSSLNVVDSPNGVKLQGSDYFKINSTTGAIDYSVTSGDFVTVSGTTNNGFTKTIKICFGATTSTGDATVISTAVTAINAGNATVANYANAGITGVTSTNLAAVNQAVATDRLGGLLTIDKIKADVLTVVGSPTMTTALATLNDATTVATLRTAIENTDLTLDLTVYNQLNSLNKNVVATDLLDQLSRLNKGFASKAAVQSALDASPVVAALAATIPATPAQVANNQYNTNLASIGNTLLAGKVNTVNKTLTISDTGASAITSSGVFADLKTLNVTGITFADGTLIPIVNAAPAVGTTPAVVDNYATVKAAVIKYFSDNGIKTGTKIDLTVKGTNGTVITETYSLVNGIN